MTDMNNRYWDAARIAYRRALEAQAQAVTYEDGLVAYDRTFRQVMNEWEQQEDERASGLFRRSPTAPGPTAPRSFSYCPECDRPIPNGINRCSHCQGV
jgi:RNA polymerase-binding transcription factor DksA